MDEEGWKCLLSAVFALIFMAMWAAYLLTHRDS